jgi:hypothetical protein
VEVKEKVEEIHADEVGWMRMRWRTITIVGVLVCFLGGMVEQSLARQPDTSRRNTPARKAEKKTTKGTAAVSSKKQPVSSNRKPKLAKREEQKPQEVRRKARTKRTTVRSASRLTKVKPAKSTVSRLQRRRASVRLARRARRAPVRVVQRTEPAIVKDYESMILADAESGRRGDR